MPLSLLGLPLLIVCFFGWVITEANKMPRLRVAFALAGFFFAIVTGTLIGGFLKQFDCNVYYGSATEDLAHTMLEQI